ncbi:hypothetical protein N657DRAFT_682884 [Parathielavia appendiculata]|uniref:Uncharacterized protein n=1 Tax=Parathielavia appendiculata TaxID=2587402 RepID=A0AAN6TUZ8_9PEZI|nr:hypothetical protein N657DRAFT_682884 [Parathielavia appendiculata]
MASGHDSHRRARTPAIDMTKFKGHASEGKEPQDGANSLISVLHDIDPQTERLHILGDAPTNEEWEILTHHFTNVRFIKLLVIADAVAERITPRAIVEGRIQSPVLLFTAGLRSRSEGVEVNYLPYQWHKWFNNHYEDKGPIFSPDLGSSPSSALKHFRILGNDALQMHSYIALAKFHRLASLSSLTICSPGRHDMQHLVPHTPLLFLPLLNNPKTFKLTMGRAMCATLLAEVVGEDDGEAEEAFLRDFLPPDIETFHFRGPVSVAPHLDECAAAFWYRGSCRG